MESSPLFDDNQHNVYQNLIGVLRWLIELGYIDILLEVSLLSQYLASSELVISNNYSTYLDILNII